MNDVPTPTPRELEILKILWEQGTSSVREVHQQLLVQEPSLAYNTVQTLLRLMETKGLVGHEANRRTFRYTARFTRDESTARFLDRVYDGAVAQLVQSLLQSERISNEELDRMQALLAEARRKNRRRGEGGSS